MGGGGGGGGMQYGGMGGGGDGSPFAADGSPGFVRMLHGATPGIFGSGGRQERNQPQEQGGAGAV